MDSPGRTLVCSVLFLDIVEYSKKPVSEQLELKQVFNQVLAHSLEHVAVRDRIILDTGDGAAVTFMGDPEDALFAAMAMRDGASVVPVRLGVNLGPVRLVKDLNDQVNIIGDGINVAQRVMSFAGVGQLLVSRSFYEVVSCLSRDYAQLFHHEGARTDKHVREHDVYSVVGTPTRAADTISARTEAGSRGWLGLRRSALVAAPLVFFAIVGAALGARAMLEPVPEPAPTPQKPAAVQRPVKVAAAPEVARPAETQKPRPVAAAETPAPRPKKSAAGRTGKLNVAVSPGGELLLNGTSYGNFPPQTEIDLAPGRYALILRSTMNTYRDTVEIKPGETTRVQYRFR